MSSIKDRLLEDMKQAMKAKAKRKLSLIRLIRAAIKNDEISRRKDLEEHEIIDILVSEIRLRREAKNEYIRLGQVEEAERLMEEIDILKLYLPQKFSAEEVEEIVMDVKKQVGAQGQRDFNKLMGAVMPKLKGRADGSFVEKIAREKLKSKTGT